MTGRPRARRELRQRRSSCTSTGSCATPALFSCEQGSGQRDPGVPSPAGRGGWPPGQRRGETLAGGGAGPGGRAGGEGREAAAVVRVGGCVCVCVRVSWSCCRQHRRVTGLQRRLPQEPLGGRVGASGLARPDPAAFPPPSLAMPAGSPPAPCCLVDRSSRGSLALSRCRAGGGLCPRAALPFRIRTNRVLCQGAQRAPARGSPIFCWAGEGVFPLPRCFYK